MSFGQIVKAGEPVHAALTGALLLKEIDHPMVYLSLIPIIGGVGLASLKEMSFTWKALICASAANQAAAFKNVVTKKTMGAPWAKELGPQNTYAVVTILSLLATLPVVLAVDLPVLPGIIKNLQAAGKLNDLIKFGVYSGTSSLTASRSLLGFGSSIVLTSCSVVRPQASTSTCTTSSPSWPSTSCPP